ncbi:MAG: hypothetical protein KJ069_29195 [Anaerolineae bacterium]|nr:hypothetical protein [Anaerolineae bacterium]
MFTGRQEYPGVHRAGKKIRDVPPSEAVPLNRIVSYLLQAVIHGRHAELRVIAAESVRDIVRDTDPTPKDAWQEKVGTLFKQLEVATHFREHLDIAALVTAVTTPHTLDDRRLLADTLVAQAPHYSQEPRLTGILAALIIESCGHNLQTAVNRLDDYLNTHPDAASDLQLLRREINSVLIAPELKKAWAESYQNPLETVRDDVRGKWNASIRSAQVGLWFRLLVGLFVSLVAALIGLRLLWQGIEGLSEPVGWPPIVQIVLGLALFTVSLVYRGPVRDLQQTLAEIGVANTVYAAFAQQSLHISHQHAALSLQNRLTTADLKESSQLLGTAMKEAVQTLRHERKPVTIDEFLQQMDS